MHDAARVRVAEPQQHLADDLDGVAPRNVAIALEPRRERLAFERLHHEVRPAIEHAEVADADDVGMVEPPRCHGLALEPRGRFGVHPEVGMEHLDRDGLADARVLRPIHAPHAAGAEHAIDAIAAIDDGTHRQLVRRARGWRSR